MLARYKLIALFCTSRIGFRLPWANLDQDIPIPCWVHHTQRGFCHVEGRDTFLLILQFYIIIYKYHGNQGQNLSPGNKAPRAIGRAASKWFEVRAISQFFPINESRRIEGADSRSKGTLVIVKLAVRNDDFRACE